MAAGRLTPGHAAPAARGVAADDGESQDPREAGVRPRRLGEPQGVGQESQDATDGATAPAGLSQASARPPPHLARGHDGHGRRVALTLTQARVGVCEGLRGLGSRRCASRERLAQGTLLVAALCGVALPLLSTGCDVRQRTHDACLPLAPWQGAPGEVLGCQHTGCLGARARWREAARQGRRGTTEPSTSSDKALPCQTTAWQPRRWLASLVAWVAMPRRREARPRVVSSGEVVRRPVCRCEVAGGVRWSTHACVCALPTLRISMAVLGTAVSHAVLSGRHEMPTDLPP